MQVAVNKLKGKMAEKEVSGEVLSKYIGIDPSTFYRKLRAKGETFTFREVFAIAEKLELSSDEASSIFFAS